MQISLKPTIHQGYIGMTVFQKFTYIYNKMNFTYCIFFTLQKSSPVLSLRYFWSQTYYSSQL